MLKRFLIHSISKFEKQTGYDSTYMKQIANYSPSLAMKFSNFIKLNRYQKKTPDDVMYIAKIAAMKTGDCGTCLQLNINFALWSGVAKQYVKDAVSNPENLPQRLKLIHDFATKTALGEPDAEIFRQKVEQQLGQDILIELAMAVATTIVYPTLKRGLGYAKSCSLMQFEYGDAS